MQANSMSFYTPLTPGWGQKVIFSEEVMLHITLKERSVKHKTSKIFDLMHIPDILSVIKKGQVCTETHACPSEYLFLFLIRTKTN